MCTVCWDWHELREVGNKELVAGYQFWGSPPAALSKKDQLMELTEDQYDTLVSYFERLREESTEVPIILLTGCLCVINDLGAHITKKHQVKHARAAAEKAALARADQLAKAIFSPLGLVKLVVVDLVLDDNLARGEVSYESYERRPRRRGKWRGRSAPPLETTLHRNAC